MSKLFELFEQIEATNSRNEKKSLLKQCSNEQKNLIAFCNHPYKQFHITKWSPQILINLNHEENLYLDFIKLCETAQKTNSSNKLVVDVESFMSCCDDLQQKWFGRILKKDMKFGAQDKTILDVFPNLYPTFNVMLANKLEKNFLNTDLPKEFCVERKYDGFRVLVIFRENGIVDVIGRSGKPILNKEFIEKVSVEKDRFKGFVLDGEAYSHEVSFEKFSGIMRTDNGKLPESLHYLVFDIITVEDLESQTNNREYYNRTLELASFENDEFYFDDNTFLRVPERYFFYNEGDIPTLLKQINDLYLQFLEEGYEGAMIKNIKAPYQFKRTDNMLKIKPVDFIDGVITGWYEGEKDTRLEGIFGGFNVELDSGVTINVGGGYKDWQRSEFTDNLKQDNNYYNGQWVTIKYTEITEAGSLRHPRFKGFRDSK